MRTALTGLENIYVSCDKRTFMDGNTDLTQWINTLNKPNITGFNNGQHCKSWDDNNKCQTIGLCPSRKRRFGSSSNDEFEFIGEVIFANKDCDKQNKNRQSLMMKIKHSSGPVTILLPGDMEPNKNDGFTEQVLRSTAYVLSHHGGDSGNPPWFMDMIKPTVIFVSG